MSSFTHSLRRIASDLLLTPDRLQAISRLDPTHIYVENIRAVFGLSTPVARSFCELAVKQGIFRKGVEVRCPDETAAVEADAVESLPPTVTCWEEIDGTLQERLYKTSQLRRADFYVYSSGGTA